MPKSEIQPVDYLTKRGRKIFQLIVKHVNDTGKHEEIDIIDLTMLCNSIDLYESAAKRVNLLREAESLEAFGSKGKLSIDYQVMLKEYEKVLKHSPKYGITPGDREKIFGGMKSKPKANPNEGLD